MSNTSSSLFPDCIIGLPKAKILLPGAAAWISQGVDHQILFMQFSNDVSVPEHAHAAQWGVVLEGRIDLRIGNQQHTFTKGDHYFIPNGVLHMARIYAGYSDVTFFAQSDRYSVMEAAKVECSKEKTTIQGE